MRFFNYILPLILLFAITSCSSKDEGSGYTPQNTTAQELYSTGVALLKEDEREEAVEVLEEIERLFPFSPLSTKAQVMVAYAYYEEQEYDDAVIAVERFLRLNPGNKGAAYMTYLKGLCFYERIADVQRDQGVTHQALGALQDVVRRYPGTDYARDAQLKIDFVYDHLAGKEIEIGRFYLDGKEYLAAHNRFRNVVTRYETSTHTPEALYRIVEASLLLGLPDEARRNAAVLGTNYPSSKWYKFAYQLLEEGKKAPEEEHKPFPELIREHLFPWQDEAL